MVPTYEPKTFVKPLSEFTEEEFIALGRFSQGKSSIIATQVAEYINNIANSKQVTNSILFDAEANFTGDYIDSLTMDIETSYKELYVEDNERSLKFTPDPLPEIGRPKPSAKEKAKRKAARKDRQRTRKHR